MDQRVESLDGFFDGGLRVESVHVVNVNIVGVEPAQAGLAGLNQMVARGAEIVGTVAHIECGFSGNQNRVAASGDGLAEDFFGYAL